MGNSSRLLLHLPCPYLCPLFSMALLCLIKRGHREKVSSAWVNHRWWYCNGNHRKEGQKQPRPSAHSYGGMKVSTSPGSEMQALPCFSIMWYTWFSSIVLFHLEGHGCLLLSPYIGEGGPAGDDKERKVASAPTDIPTWRWLWWRQCSRRTLGKKVTPI